VDRAGGERERYNFSGMKIAVAALCAAVLIAAGSASHAQTPGPAKQTVRSAADLPRYTYSISGTATELLHADPQTFGAFASKVRADIEATLAGYDVADHATLRSLLATELEVQVLGGENDAARETLRRIRSLEDKPDAKLLSGLRTEAILDARKSSGATSGEAFGGAFARKYREKLAPLPWAIVGTSLKESKSGLQLLSASLVEGRVQAAIEPAVSRSHAMGNELAAGLIDARFALNIVVPVKDLALAAVSAVVAAHNVVKPDVWAAREVSFPSMRGLTPVRVAIWDSGTDVALFPQQLFTDPRPTLYDAHGLAFDLLSYRTHGSLYPLTAAERRAYPEMRRYLKGFSDLQLSIDSPEAAAVRQKVASLKPDAVPGFFEQLGLFGNFVHGTHVSGIAVRGNPAARIVVGRITFDHKTVPTPPSDALEQRGAVANKAYVDYFRTHGVRVVNMSWGGTPAGDEEALEKNGLGKDAADRKRLAAHYFAIDRKGLTDAIASAPGILFICAAGNANQNSSFNEDIPASIHLPNLFAVGAVDQAGDETSFTSYGPTVLVDASGYQVDSPIPGGTHVRLSGTSMASPNVVNLAAKLFALDPKLRPADVIRLIRDGATTTPDGRRHLIDPKRSIALLQRRRR
jgi:subtilisin family serine protease